MSHMQHYERRSITSLWRNASGLQNATRTAGLIFNVVLGHSCINPLLSEFQPVLDRVFSIGQQRAFNPIRSITWPCFRAGSAGAATISLPFAFSSSILRTRMRYSSLNSWGLNSSAREFVNESDAGINF